MAWQLGEVRAATEADFDALKSLLHNHEGWHKEFHMKGRVRTTTAWTKRNDVSDFRMIKVSELGE